MFDAISAGIASDGTVPVGVARQMFQLFYGGLEGVTLPGGAPDRNLDGTMALAAMETHRAELPAADQARLDAVIDAGGPISSTIPVTGIATPGTGVAGSARAIRRSALSCAAAIGPTKFGTPLPDSNSNVADLELLVAHWNEQIATALGTPLGLPIWVVDYPKANPDAAADAYTFDDQCGGGRRRCVGYGSSGTGSRRQEKLVTSSSSMNSGIATKQ